MLQYAFRRRKLRGYLYSVCNLRELSSNQSKFNCRLPLSITRYRYFSNYSRLNWKSSNTGTLSGTSQAIVVVAAAIFVVKIAVVFVVLAATATALKIAVVAKIVFVAVSFHVAPIAALLVVVINAKLRLILVRQYCLIILSQCNQSRTI